MGIDGFTDEGYPFQIRQEDDVGKRAIDSFAAAMGRSKARNGTIVAFSFGRDALEGVTRAKTELQTRNENSNSQGVNGKRKENFVSMLTCVGVVVGPLGFEPRIARAPGVYPNPS